MGERQECGGWLGVENRPWVKILICKWSEVDLDEYGKKIPHSDINT